LFVLGRYPGCPVASGALGDEDELAAWAVGGVSYVQHAIAVSGQA
jgi:hypothetical protein